MSATIPVLRMDQDISLSEALDLLEQVSLHLGIYAKATRDLSWNVVTAADLEPGASVHGSGDQGGRL